MFHARASTADFGRIAQLIPIALHLHAFGAQLGQESFSDVMVPLRFIATQN
jgi:hypothetical protein